MKYKIISDPEQIGLERAFKDHSNLISKALRQPLDPVINGESEDESNSKEEIILEEEQEIQKAVFLLRLLKLK